MTRAAEPMPIKAIAPWFGAKRSLAGEIVRALGPHRVYWEPFCGSMAVLLAKPPCAMETVNDLHSDLVNLARTVQDPTEGPRLYRMLRRTLLINGVHREAQIALGELPPTGTLRAYWYFVESWLGRNGCAGTSSTNNGFCVRFTGNGGSPAVRFESAVRSIPAWRSRLRRVVVLQEDAFELLDRIEDAAGTAIYCDPPYLTKGCKYIHDFDARSQGVALFGDAHDRLASALDRFERARVVVSYYDHPRLEHLYPSLRGWRKETFEVSKSLAHQGRRGANKTKALEVLLVNDGGGS